MTTTHYSPTIEHMNSPVNPLRAEREAQRLSVANLALRAGVSRQYVIRAEQATYPSVPVVLVEALWPDSADYEMDAVASEYLYFQERTRRANYDLLPAFPFGEWFYSPRLHPLTFWRHQASPVVNLTQVAKSWCIPQSVLFKFESQPWAVPNVPEPLLEAMVEAGHTDYECEALKVAYASFQASAASAVRTA